MHRSTLDTNEKKSLRRFEIPLNKFNEVAVPYHVDLLHKHKNNIQRFERLGQWEAARKEHVNAGRAVQQLKALLYEIDGLRQQICDEDLEDFSKRTAKARQSVQQGIQAYLDMEKPGAHMTMSPSQEWPGAKEEGGLEDAQLPPLQIHMDTLAEEEDLAKREAYLKSWEQLHTEFQDLQQLFQDFAAMVQTQGDLVNQVETHTETAAENVEAGAQHLAYASRIQAASYPLVGALLGTCVGGPIGFLAGIKLGGLAALSGSFLGFTGGRFLKNKQIEGASEEKTEQPELDIQTNTETQIEKKGSTSCLNLIS